MCKQTTKLGWCWQEEYRFCYEAALNYLSSFDHYTSWALTVPAERSLYQLSALFTSFISLTSISEGPMRLLKIMLIASSCLHDVHAPNLYNWMRPTFSYPTISVPLFVCRVYTSSQECLSRVTHIHWHCTVRFKSLVVFYELVTRHEWVSRFSPVIRLCFVAFSGGSSQSNLI